MVRYFVGHRVPGKEMTYRREESATPQVLEIVSFGRSEHGETYTH
jgi:hypothetical protein